MRIVPFSAFKVGFFVNGLLALIFGGCAMLPMIMTGGMLILDRGSSGMGSFGLALGVVFFVGIVFFSAVMGGVTAAIMAFIYNLISGPFGGLEVELVDSPSSMPAKREL